MIARLSGRVVEKTPGRLVVDVNGVGYDVLVPLSTYYVAGDAGAAVTLRVHTHVREDALALYGFATALEQELFERLIAISGVGPKLALAVLSGIEPAELVRAVRTADVARLTRIPGIGKKTAERIGLELKDRLPAALAAPGHELPAPAAEDRLRDDLVSALLNLGYARPVAEKAIERTLADRPDAGFEAALREALKSMMKA